MKYKTAIFDLDGTLYRQCPVQMSMGIRIFSYILKHPYSIRLFLGILVFRRIREDKDYYDFPIERHIESAANVVKVNVNDLRDAIYYWMFSNPLDLLFKYRNEQVINKMVNLRKEGFQIVIYSDYPTEEKIEALQLAVDYQFYPGAGFNELKPSKKAMRFIINEISADERFIIYFGDRAKKDGKAAEFIGAKYYYVTKFGGIRYNFRRNTLTKII